MRIAIISDIHGNYVALEALLADLKQEAVDQVVCLGDAIQGGPQPREVVAQLRELAYPVVMGNADDWMLTGIDKGTEPMSETRRIQLDAIRDWQLSILSAEDKAFIEAFQATIEIPIHEGLNLLCFHGSSQDFNHIIRPLTPDEEVISYLNPDQEHLYTGGHTHVQFIRHFGRVFYFNPGSVGFAYRHNQAEGDFKADPWAEYAILTAENQQLSLTFKRVPYDAARLIDVYRASGRPYSDVAIAQYQEGK